MFSKGLNKWNPFEPVRDSVPYIKNVDTRDGYIKALQADLHGREIQSQVETKNYYIDNGRVKKKDNDLLYGFPYGEFFVKGNFLKIFDSYYRGGQYLTPDPIGHIVLIPPENIDGYKLVAVGMFIYNKFGTIVDVVRFDDPDFIADLLDPDTDTTVPFYKVRSNIPKSYRFDKKALHFNYKYFAYYIAHDDNRKRIIKFDKSEFSAIPNSYVLSFAWSSGTTKIEIRIDEADDTDLFFNPKIGYRYVGADGKFFSELRIVESNSIYTVARDGLIYVDIMEIPDDFFDFDWDYIEFYALIDTDSFVKTAEVYKEDIQNNIRYFNIANADLRLNRILIPYNDLPIKSFENENVNGIFENSNFLYIWKKKQLYVSFPKNKNMLELDRYMEFQENIKKIDQIDKILISTDEKLFSYDENKNSIIQTVIDVKIDDLKIWNDRIYILSNGELYQTNLYSVKPVLKHKIRENDKIESFTIDDNGNLIMRLEGSEDLYSRTLFYDPDADFLTFINDSNYITPCIIRLPIISVGQPFGSGRLLKFEIVYKGNISIKVYGDSHLEHLQKFIPNSVTPLDQIVLPFTDNIQIYKGAFDIKQSQQFLFVDIILHKDDDGNYGEVYNIFIETTQNRR